MKFKTVWIPQGSTQIFCNACIADKAEMNIIVTHTPVCSTTDIQKAYEPLTEYPVNIFAFDFSGTGKSSGAIADFSKDSIVADLDAVVDYIEQNYQAPVHLYGNTGIGGMFAQYYISHTSRIQSFAQFACVDYGNTAALGYPNFVVNVLCWFLKHLPNFYITMKPPKYKGFHCELDNGFYQECLARNPHFFKSPTKILNTMLSLFVSSDSTITSGIKIPTLVFKTLHDRYFPKEFFDSYYSSLKCEKKLIEIDDIHNSYYYRSEEYCENVYQWFHAHQSK